MTDWTQLTQSPLNQHVYGTREKIAIIGANYCRELADILEDPTWEVWSCNLLVTPCLDSQNRLRADKWFELHQLKAQNEEDLAWIKACPVPLYMAELPENTADAPTGIKFPLQQAIDQGREYFHCTFALQVAFALSLGYVKEIGLFGVNLPLGSRRERTLERACLEYWLGVAEGRGVIITIPFINHVRCLFSPFVYGFEYDEEKGWVDVQMKALKDIAHD